MKGYSVSDSSRKGCLLYLLFSVAVLTGLASIVCVLFWKFTYDGGFGWRDDPGKQFAWHPLLLTIAIVLSGVGSSLYRVLTISRTFTKSIHVGCMFLSMVSGAIGLWAVLDSHNLASPPIPNFFSLHSWVGVSVLGVLVLQFLFGSTTFLFPCCSSSKRAGFLPFHKFFGVVTLIGATAAAIIGLTEEALFSMPDYSNLPEKGVVINVMGVLLVVFTGVITFINTYREFRLFN